VTPPEPLPPLVLSCRVRLRVALLAAALVLLGLGTAALAGEPDPRAPRPAAIAGATVFLLLGAGSAHLFLRFGLARLVLDDRGFTLAGPFHRAAVVRWDGVASWRALGPRPGPRTLHLRLDDGRRLSLPLVFEDSHLVEVGLAQRQFPSI
jgi:hypothetical protein